jgi:ribosomal protein S11
LNLTQLNLVGESAVAFPKLQQFRQLTRKVQRWEERNKSLVIKEAELVLRAPGKGRMEARLKMNSALAETDGWKVPDASPMVFGGLWKYSR